MSREYVAIVGTRNVVSGDVAKQVYEIIRSLPQDTVFVTGDCPTGIDAVVRQNCKRKRFLVECHAPWDTFKLSAGPKRNEVIAHIADRGIAFPHGESRGTRGCARLFESYEKDIKVIEI